MATSDKKAKAVGKQKHSDNHGTSNAVLATSTPSTTPPVTTALYPRLGLQRPLIQHDVKKVLFMRQ